MEPIFKEENTVPATEILYFPSAEIEKVKGNGKCFASLGPLSCLYFKDYNRFVLQVNDWKYTLLRRLPIMCYDKNSQNDRLYQLPAANGFSFNLRIKSHHSLEALHNFETILRENACFYYRGEDTSNRKMEASPDDKLTRQTSDMKKEHGVMDMINEHLQKGIEKSKQAGSKLKESTKNMGSKKSMMNLRDIKHKNYKDTIRSTFKHDWFEKHEKMTKDIHVMRKHNFSNFKDNRDIEELRKADHLPIFYLPKEDVEECILHNKDLAGMVRAPQQESGQRTEGQRGGEQQHTQIREAIRHEFRNIKENLTGRVNKAEAPKDQHQAFVESMTHYEA